MENAAPGSGKKPQKRTPSRPASPTRKPAAAKKPAASTPAARKKAAAAAAAKVEEVVVEETLEEALIPVDETVEVVEEGAVLEEDTAEAEAEAADVEQVEQAELETESEPEPEPEPEPEAEPESASQNESASEVAEAELGSDDEAATATERPTFSLPRLTVPKITLPTAAIARASRAVADRVKAVTSPEPEAAPEVGPEGETEPTSEVTPDEAPVAAPEPSTEAALAEKAPEPAQPTAVATRKPAAKKPAKTPRAPRKSSKKTDVPAVLTVSGLTKRFGDTTAVNAIDLSVPAGAFYGIVGPNGAGKTTTLSMVTGLLRPDEGTVAVHGADVWSNPAEAKRNMGVLPDRLRLFDRLTGAQLLYYSGVLRGLTSAVTKERITDLAEILGIQDALGRLVSDYSSGMSKKVALAAALIHAPRLLVLDEPFESVDPVSAATVTGVLKNYVAKGGTVLLSSHSMDLVERICDNVAIIVGGSVLADGTIAEVRGRGTLEEKFVELAGSRTTVEGLEWLHSFSD